MPSSVRTWWHHARVVDLVEDQRVPVGWPCRAVDGRPERPIDTLGKHPKQHTNPYFDGDVGDEQSNPHSIEWFIDAQDRLRPARAGRMP